MSTSLILFPPTPISSTLFPSPILSALFPPTPVGNQSHPFLFYSSLSSTQPCSECLPPTVPALRKIDEF